jgi:hypothetical protein
VPETVVRFDDRRPIPAAVFIGNENDNLVESVEFELADWLSEAIVYMYLTANGKSDVVNLGTDRVFDITRTHTHEAGRWEAYLEAYLNGDRVWHSDEFAMYVGALPAIGKQIEQQYPTAIEDALKAAEALTGLKARAETLPEGSEPTVRFDEEAGEIVYGLPLGPKGDAGFSPTIKTTTVSGGYEISITNPDGSMSVFTVKNGMSPTVRVSKIDGGNRVTITDASGPKTFDVMDGKDGDEVTADAVKAALGYTPASDARVSVLEQDMAEVKKITDNFELFVPKFANTAEGETLVLTDSADGALQGMTVYGKTTQDGTPTPDAPVPLVSAGDDGAVDVSITRRNLLRHAVKSVTQNGISIIANDDGSLTFSGTCTAQTVITLVNNLVLPVGTYTIGFTNALPTSGIQWVVEDYSIKTGSWVGNLVSMYNGVSKSFAHTRSDTIILVYCKIFSGATIDLTLYPQIEVGSVATAYEPYEAPRCFTLSTPNGLPSVGDVYDEIDLERGVYVQRVGKIAVDTVKEVYDDGRVWYTVVRPSSKGKGYSPVASTHFVGTTGKLNAGNVVVTSTGNIQAALVDQTIQTADAWNAWLTAQTLPLEIVYTLATPIETPLSAEEITAFKALKTHYPTTTIYNDESARMTVKYAADTKNYIDNHLAALAAAMVNNL